MQRNNASLGKMEKSRRVETRWIVSRSSFEARLELHRDKFRTIEEILSKSVTGGLAVEEHRRLFNWWTNPEERSKIVVGSQSRRRTRLSRNRESESLEENARCGVTVTRVSVSEPSRREKEPERGSFGAKQNGFIGNYKKRERKREREIDRSVSKEFVAVTGPGS